MFKSGTVNAKGGGMKSNSFLLAWQLFCQEYAQRNQQYLRWIFTILMVFVVSLSQTSQSIQQYLAGNLASLLGADVVISQAQGIQSKHLTAIKTHATNVVETQTISTTLTHKNRWQRVKLKAVTSGYPLQGNLKAANALDGNETIMSSGPQQGTIWLDSRLIAGLSTSIGENLTIANSTFRVSHVLIHEPDRLMEGHNVDMRAMIHSDDLAKLNVSNDLVTHRYLIEATKQQINNLISYQQTHLPAAQIYHKQGAHPLAVFWKRVENFLGLASIILFFMAAIAIEQLSQIQIRKEQYFSAVCMSLGATKASSISISLWKWLLRFTFMIPAVLIFSGLCHYLMIDWLTSTFQGLPFNWYWFSAFKSLCAMFMLFIIMQIPVWLALKKASVAKLLQSKESPLASWIIKTCSLTTLALIAYVYSDNGLLTTMVLTAIFVCVVLIIFTSWTVMTLGEKLSKNVSGLLPFTLFMMRQRIATKSTQILGVGLSAFLLLFTLMLMKDLGQTMSAYQRQHDGNLLISQASEQQMLAVEKWAVKHNVDIRQSKPFYYAKLTAINAIPLDKYTNKPSETLATFKRSIRLHWTESVPLNNQLLTGQWWSKEPKNWQQISVEEEVMTDLGLSLGDKMTFYINKQPTEFTIVASHGYQSGAGSITFWVQMPAIAHQYIHADKFYMASLELSENQFELLGRLWQQYPTLRMSSLKEMTAQFDKTLAMVTSVISGFSILIIILSIFVTVSSVQALETKEKKKNSIILSFGFTKKTTLKLNLIEWIATGMIAASGAIISTYLAGVLIYQSQFSLTYRPDFVWLLMTISVILLTVISIGVWASKRSLTSSVRELLAE